MSFLELARKRCSIRKYAPKNVEQEKIDYILEAARLAPSAVNYQPWYFVWVQSAEGKAKLQECYPREWFKQAPYYLIVCGDIISNLGNGAIIRIIWISMRLSPRNIFV